MIQLHNDGDTVQPAPEEHLYTNQTSPYFRAPHIYLAIAARFLEGRKVINEEQAKAIGVHTKFYHDVSDSVLLTSRGGNMYDRTFLEGYIKPGIGPNNWVSRTNYPALNIVPTGSDEMSLYVNQNCNQPSAHLRRYSMRLDGLASVRAGAQTGEMITKPMRFLGNKLSINFATSAAGSIQIELQDVNGVPYPGFAIGDCQPQIGNETDRIVRWKNGANVATIAGKAVRMRLRLRDVDLFAFQFQE